MRGSVCCLGDVVRSADCSGDHARCVLLCRLGLSEGVLARYATAVQDSSPTENPYTNSTHGTTRAACCGGDGVVMIIVVHVCLVIVLQPPT